MARPKRNKEIKDGSVDAGLLLLALTGKTYTLPEIAFVCGCSAVNIKQLEDRAIEKFLKAMKKRMDNHLAPDVGRPYVRTIAQYDDMSNIMVGYYGE